MRDILTKMGGVDVEQSMRFLEQCQDLQEMCDCTLLLNIEKVLETLANEIDADGTLVLAGHRYRLCPPAKSDRRAELEYKIKAGFGMIRTDELFEAIAA